MRGRRYTVKAAASLLLAATTMAACGPSSPSRTGATTTPAPPATRSTTLPTAPTTTTAPPSTPTSPSTSQPPAATKDVRVYFVRDGKIDVAHRTVGATLQIASAALDQLLSGTSPEDSAAGLATAIPAGTRLLGVTIVGGTATVDLSGTFATTAGSSSVQERLAQVVYTLTQFPTVTQVALHVDGKALSSFGDVDLSQPATRSTFPALAPPALIELPGRNWAVPSPIRLAGTAAVFEGQFRAELTDSNGHVIATMAMYAPLITAIGGPFDTEMTYPAGTRGPATLTLYDYSMKDGSRIDLASIPLELTG